MNVRTRVSVVVTLVKVDYVLIKDSTGIFCIYVYNVHRWSYCEDSDDDDARPEVKVPAVDAEPSAVGAAAVNGEPVVSVGGGNEKNEDAVEDDDYEWEYFYEDVDEATDKKAKPAADQPPAPAAKVTLRLFVVNRLKL